MNIREISKDVFDEFSKSHVLGSFYQTSAYGSLMGTLGYNEVYVGAYVDEKLVGGALILTRTISLNVKYGYSPRGFLIDYFSNEMLRCFTEGLKAFFAKKGYAFIKINPIITLCEVNKDNGDKILNSKTESLFELLEENGYKKLKDNLYFESVLPKFNPIVNLSEFSINSIDKKLSSKINKLRNKGLSLRKCDIYEINTFYEFVKRKDDTSDEFYKTLYKKFDKKGMVDLFVIEEDYHNYLLYLQEEFTIENTINEKLNKIFQMDPTNKNVLNEKMNSDRLLNEINEEIAATNLKIQNGEIKEVIASALVIKYNNIASIYASGFNKQYNKILPNHYLHYSLLYYYKEQGFKFFDLNGFTGDFSKDNPYKGLNDFKKLWNPKIYEYIGEFDLIINQTKYSLLLSTKALQKEFEKKGLKSTNS